MAWGNTGFELGEKCGEDRDGDGLNRFPIFLTVIFLDPADKASNDRGITGVERDVCISMEGTNGSEVCLNCFGLDTSSKVCNPGHDCDLGSGEDGAVSIV